MGRRRSPRVAFESSVRIFGTDAEGGPFTRLASTVDVSPTGVRVSGIHVRLRVGDVVGIQSGGEKARYSVVWIGSPGTARAGELGLRCAEPNRWIWKIARPKAAEDTYEPQPDRVERRRHARFACDIGIEIKTNPEGPSNYTRCTDISVGGCYLETWSPQPVGTLLSFTAKLLHGELRGVATVRAMHPAFGMGLQFLRLDNPELLKDLVGHLAENAVSPPRATAIRRPAPPSSVQDIAATAPVVLDHIRCEAAHSRVLVAEDSRFLRNAYSHFLSRAGFEVMQASDGEDMLRMALAQLPDVIVLDLLMPKMGGVDALKLLKDDPATADIPVIVISALSQSNEQKLIAAGAQCYVEKVRAIPESLPEIVTRTLRTVQRQSRTYSPARDNAAVR